MNETPKTFEEAQKMFKSEKLKAEEKETKKPDDNVKANNTSKTVEIPFCSHKIESKPPTEEEAEVSSSVAQISTSSPLPFSKLGLSQEERKAAEDILKELVEIRKEGKQKSDPILDTMIRLKK